jgi:hypothetical protein
MNKRLHRSASFFFFYFHHFFRAKASLVRIIPARPEALVKFGPPPHFPFLPGLLNHNVFNC